MRELMLFRAGRYRLALALPTVRGIHPAGDLRIAAPGRCTLDGREMALYDLGARLGGRNPDAGNPRVIRIEAAGRPMALRVDAVERVVGVAEERIVPLPPAFRGRPARWFPAVVRDADTLALLLSPEGMAGIVPPEPEPEPEPGPEPSDAVFAAWLPEPDRMAEILIRALERTLRSALRRHLRALPARLLRAEAR